MNCAGRYGGQRVANLGCAAVAARLDEQLALDLAELERDVFARRRDRAS